MKLPIDYGVALCVFNAPSHRYLQPYSLSKFVGALVLGAAMGFAVEASDYNYGGARQNQSWGDRQTNSDYATRWDRKTKPWSREPSGVTQSEIDNWGNGFSASRDDRRVENSYSANRWDWQAERHDPYSGDSWRSIDEWYRAPAYDGQHVGTVQEERAGTRQRMKQWASSADQRVPRMEAENRHKSNLQAESRSPSEGLGNQWSADTSWPRSDKRTSSSGAYGNNQSREYNWPQSSPSGSSDGYSSSGYGLSATQNRRVDDPWRSSKSYASVTDPSRRQKHWVGDRKNSEGNKPWGGHHPNNSQGRQQSNSQRSSPLSSTQSIPSVDVTRSGYSEYPGYLGYPEHYVPYSGIGAQGYGYYPEHNYGWLGGMYSDPRNFPLLDDLLWFF
uniref:Uncharacterized protein n=1 Tax=Candidatus Kentrum sp. FW TaxID=2126338 RepID=A0A450SSU6_9GAMM|nr:MAG: hypothetical protein BECKFW1821A_GA0114235_101026 [Candidatus Kentron sp. FW]VFJ57147.1 MAG: hypothetical protein BECKFW1821B_GA0114236_103211 [Candidatus Kentron sp. FW]